MSENKYNLQVGDIIIDGEVRNTVTEIVGFGANLHPYNGHDTWSFINRNIDSGNWTIERAKKPMEKEIIGYKVPFDIYVVQNNPWKKDEVAFKHLNNYAVEGLRGVLPIQIVEKWEPVYKAEEIIIQTGNPAKEIKITKNGASFGSYIFSKAVLDTISAKFHSFAIAGTSINGHVKKVWIGCEEGTEITKEDINVIINNVVKLNKNV